MYPFRIYKPVHPAVITQGFGQNLVPFYKEFGMSGHNGHDFVRKGDTHEANVRAAHMGIVFATGIDGDGGYAVHVRTAQQFNDELGKPHWWVSIYYHLTPKILVRPGQTISIGTHLGYLDNTGKYTTGEHLHFGLKKQRQIDEWRWETIDHSNGYFGAVDPMPYWQEMTAYEFKRRYLDPVWNLAAAFSRP